MSRAFAASIFNIALASIDIFKNFRNRIVIDYGTRTRERKDDEVGWQGGQCYLGVRHVHGPRRSVQVLQSQVGE